MGLFDSIVGAIQTQTETSSAAHGDLMSSVLALVNNPETGGLQGLVQKLSEGGLAEQVESWVGTGQNLPVTAEQIESVLGLPVVQDIANKLGIDTSAVASGLATLLPQVINHLSPNGQLPIDAANITQALSGLSGLFGHTQA